LPGEWRTQSARSLVGTWIAEAWQRQVHRRFFLSRPLHLGQNRRPLTKV
jgi:hypothetical protein